MLFFTVYLVGRGNAVKTEGLESGSNFGDLFRSDKYKLHINLCII